jgi:hypothetical protein
MRTGALPALPSGGLENGQERIAQSGKTRLDKRLTLIRSDRLK